MMAHWLVITTDRPGCAAARAAARDAHLRHLREGTAGARFLLGSALTGDDGMAAEGSWMVLEAPDRVAAEAFVAADPFAEAVFAGVSVHCIATSFDPSRYLK